MEADKTGGREKLLTEWIIEQLEESHRICVVVFGEMMAISIQEQPEEAPTEEAKQEIRHQIETREKFKEQ
jgi:hypothetical protein